MTSISRTGKYRRKNGQGKVFVSKIYLGNSAAISGKLLDQLASWPPQRQPCCLQRTSIQKLQPGFDENNWPHLSL